MSNVSIRGIAKSYQPEVPVLQPIDLDIPDGELFFLLGPSGCGKSTLLRIIAGLVKPDCGKILFDDEDITGLPPEKRRTAMVFQNYALWPHLTVFENVAFGLRSEGADNETVKREVAAALAVVQLSDFAKRKVTSLSGGQQQRVALARALAVKPRLLLLDEPLSNLEARLRDEMRCEIRRICKEKGLTAVYVTHDRNEALSMADRIAVMHGGVLQQVGTPQKVYEQPRNSFVAKFLGDTNLIKTEQGTVSIRPECVRIGDTGDIKAELVSGTYLGDHSEWVFRAADGQQLLVTEYAPPPRRAGECYFLSLDNDRKVLLED